MTTTFEMAKLKIHSKEWYKAEFERVTVTDYLKVIAAHICNAYNITGQADPGYIANLINRYVTEKPTVCPKTATGEHSDLARNTYHGNCPLCWQNTGESK